MKEWVGFIAATDKSVPIEQSKLSDFMDCLMRMCWLAGQPLIQLNISYL